jgi:hypothetical protein
VRDPDGVPPWAGAGFKNFGIYLGQKTLVHPLCPQPHFEKANPSTIAPAVPDRTS